MGIQELAGLALVVSGATTTGRGLRALMRARRNEARSGAIQVRVWSDLLLGLGLLGGGVLYLGDPHYPQHITGLRWIPAGFAVAGLVLTVVPWIMSRRARRLDASSAGGPGLSSASMPDPGPAIAPDAKTAGLIERIKTVTFSTTRLSSGYDEEEVDVFLDQLVAALGRTARWTARNCVTSSSARRGCAPGYVIADVDAFMEEVAPGDLVTAGLLGHADTRCPAYRRCRPGQPGRPGRTRPWPAPAGTPHSSREVAALSVRSPCRAAASRTAPGPPRSPRRGRRHAARPGSRVQPCRPRAYRLNRPRTEPSSATST